MNGLATLGRAWAKNRLPATPTVAQLVRPEIFKSMKSPRQKAQKDKLYSYGIELQQYRDRLHAVGKGSQFHRKSVQEYLLQYKEFPMARHDIDTPYDEERATKMDKDLRLVKSSVRAKEIFYQRSHKFVGDLVGMLITCTDTTKSTNSDVAQNIKFYQRFTTVEVPQIPNFEGRPELFASYIGLLTHTKFLYRNSSSANGVVPKILKNLMHPANYNTMHLRTTETYNDMIYYFSEKFDFATCRELFIQMKIEKIRPNTKTYNLMLRNLVKNSHIRKSKLPYTEVIFYLKKMQQQQVSADSVTWTTCYNFLMDDVSRDFYITQMVEKKVPITVEFIYTVLKNSKQSIINILHFLAENNIPFNRKIFDLCIHKLIDEGRGDVAWIFMQTSLQKRDRGFTINITSFEPFFKYFASKGRIDLAIMMVNTCSLRYKIPPDEQTFKFLFKALVYNGYTKNFGSILEYLKQLRCNHALVSRNNYWIVKANSIAKFNCLNTPTKETLMKTTSLLKDLQIVVNPFVTSPWKTGNPSVRKAIRFLGCLPRHMRQPKRPDNKISSSQITEEKKKRYRRRIGNIAIENGMMKRVPYADNWYKALKSELSSRGIIDEKSEI